MKTKIIAVLAAVMASMFVTSPAMAEDTTTTEAVIEAPEPVAPEETTEEAAPVPEVGEPVAKKSKPPKEEHTESICHPVNGKGELGNGWNLISPDKHSSHIDEQGNGKHESNDGRTDVLAVNGECPTPPKEVKGVIEGYWLVLPPGTQQAPFAGGPQPALEGIPEAKCKPMLIQHDWYEYNSKAEKKAILSFWDDGVLHDGEDHEYVVDWEFITVPGDPSKCVTKIDIPAAPPITDPCGAGNAVWNLDGLANEQFDWVLKDNGVLVAKALPGFKFKGDNPKKIVFGQAPETNTEACPVPPMEEPPVAEEPPTADPPATTAVLPDTGADSNLVALGLLALGMVVMGGGLAVAGRRI